ncbi:hypothetical protein [Phenylobacterium sp.]|uniref:hypothetical protein n=1 Tax=Phenylobacterium sp. TaxID=1871053 RepID=UPI00273399A5|nr:hypothetical protein [Phenylobacterium sp.]MDP3658599.1 hypothetical protein [Phenylobacterium sp.]
MSEKHMARMSTSQPRTVQDVDGEPYRQMIAGHQQRQSNLEKSLTDAGQKVRAFAKTHPGAIESIIPVWGSAREAIADASDGDVPGAVGNALLAGTDLLAGGLIVKGVVRGAKVLRPGVSTSWKAVRGRMGKEGYLQPYQHGHHALIPNNGWGKAIPDAIKNHPLNIKGMPNREVHGRIHGSYKSKLQYSIPERYYYGTPAWVKAGSASAVGHPVVSAREAAERRR